MLLKCSQRLQQLSFFPSTHNLQVLNLLAKAKWLRQRVIVSTKMTILPRNVAYYHHSQLSSALNMFKLNFVIMATVIIYFSN